MLLFPSTSLATSLQTHSHGPVLLCHVLSIWTFLGIRASKKVPPQLLLYIHHRLFKLITSRELSLLLKFTNVEYFYSNFIIFHLVWFLLKKIKLKLKKKLKPVQTSLARVFQFGSGFFSSAWFFSGFFSVWFFWFQIYKTKTELVGFFKILIGFRFFLFFFPVSSV
jgi:hypothetical protein